MIEHFSLTIEEGQQNEQGISLSSAPAGSVTVSIARSNGDSDLAVNTTLTFNETNWNVVQYVPITAGLDADNRNGSAWFTATADGWVGNYFQARELDLQTPVREIPIDHRSLPTGT